MPQQIVPPSTERKAFNCPVCGALADQTWYEVGAREEDHLPLVAKQHILEHVESLPASTAGREEFMRRIKRAMLGDIFFPEEDPKYFKLLENLFISKCRSCDELTLWKHDAILYPPTQYDIEPNQDLSDEIKADFNEARTILDLSPRGAAALLRLCIQKLCEQLGMPGKNINADIAALVKAGLDPRVQKALDYVRVIGNEAVHPGRIDLKDDRDTAAKLFALINRIADDMITHPKELDALFDSLPQAKKDEIAKRDAKAKASA